MHFEVVTDKQIYSYSTLISAYKMQERLLSLGIASVVKCVHKMRALKR